MTDSSNILTIIRTYCSSTPAITSVGVAWRALEPRKMAKQACVANKVDLRQKTTEGKDTMAMGKQLASALNVEVVLTLL